MADKQHRTGETRCWSCTKACGGCSWTELDDTGEVKFQPVPGWTAIPTKIQIRSHSNMRNSESYLVLDCPEYEWDGKRLAFGQGIGTPIEKLDFFGNVLARYGSIKAAGNENGIDVRQITKACDGYINIVGGYMWRYAEGYV